MHRDPYRYYRRSMRRYRRGRYSDYPVLLLGTGEPLGWLALAAIGRWAYRHRSAFLPLLIAAAAFIVAAVLHRHHAGAWIAVTVVTTVVTTVTVIHAPAW